MGILETIKALPPEEDLEIVLGCSASGDGYETQGSGVTTDDLKALAERHEALLAAAIRVDNYVIATANNIRRTERWAEFRTAIAECEKE